MSSDQIDGAANAKQVGVSYRVPALEKGLEVLECLANQGSPMTQSQLARALGRGPNELFRTLMRECRAAARHLHNLPITS